MEKKNMTNKRTYGRIQVAIPMETKTKTTEWYQNSGLKRAEFFRVALMIGVCKLA